MAVVLSERAERAKKSWRETQIWPQGIAVRPFGAGASIGRLGRSIGQIALFAVFGLYGALMSVVVVPSYSILVQDRPRRTRGIRRIMYTITRTYVASMRTLRLIDLEVRGLSREPAPGTLIVANHPSLIDALILLGHVKDAGVVAKRSLQVNPITGGGIRGANYVVNADPRALVEECCARIAAGETLVLFPECTRTADDGVIRLRRGAAHIAVRSLCTVIPVTIEFSEPLLTKKSRWWLAPKVRPRVRVTGHAAIDPAQFLQGGSSVSLAARRLTEHLRQLYVDKLKVMELARRGPA
ncbi:MAG TPA: lysophospholipid acyltransferase family protein [Burkholderiaceae bacterium]|nr:lysophospholipid acyltransferase family protein [Burkholderiaceae bacterium]